MDFYRHLYFQQKKEEDENNEEGDKGKEPKKVDKSVTKISNKK